MYHILYCEKADNAHIGEISIYWNEALCGQPNYISIIYNCGKRLRK